MSSRKILIDDQNSTAEAIFEAPANSTGTAVLTPELIPESAPIASAPIVTEPIAPPPITPPPITPPIASAPIAREQEAPARDAMAGAFPDWDLLPPTTFVKRIVRKKVEPAQL